MVDEKTIIKRDKERPLGCQMGKRSLILLNDFKEDKYESDFILDTSDLSIEDIVEEIENSNRFILNK